MDRLFTVLPKVLHKHGISAPAHSALAVHRITDWLASRFPQVHEYFHVLKVQDGVIFITCTHSIALQECQSASAELLQYVRVECPFTGIKEVRVVRA